MIQVQRTGIKIRDFAYGPPYTSPSVSVCVDETTHSADSESSPIILNTVTPGITQPKRTTEIFDPYLAFTEIDYRWSEARRTLPVSGKTLRRLLDMGWLSRAELSARAHELDLTALGSFDGGRAAARDSNGGEDAFPWRPVGVSAGPPTSEERVKMLANQAAYWRHQDRRVLSQAAKAEWRLQEERLALQKKKEIEDNRAAIEERAEQERRKLGKRRMEDGLVIKDKQSPGPSSGPKRRRLSPDTNADGGVLMPPRQQYPAPLQAYNPELYPDAARIIAASSQSRPRPFDRPSSQPPPAPERQSAPIVNNRGVSTTGVSGNSEKPAQKTSGLQRSSLMRTQTFADL